MSSSVLLDQPQLSQYPQRYFIAAIFCSLNFVNAMCWVVVTSISVPVARAFDQAESTVALVPMCYTILYFAINIPANWVLDNRGIKIGIIIGAVLTAIGTGVRCLVTTSFAFVILGQALCGVGQPFILNAAAKIAIRWFLLKDRPPAMALLAMSNVIGTAFGFILPSIFVTSDASDQQIRTSFAFLLLLQFILALFPATTVLLYFQQRPPTPASVEASKDQIKLWPTFKSLMTSKKFLGILYGYGTVMACFSSAASLLDSFYDCYGYSTSQVSILGVAFTIIGATASTIFGAFLKRKRNFRTFFVICATIGTIFWCLSPVFIKTIGYNFPILFVMQSLRGIALISLIPLTFDYACDTLYPAGQALISGLLIAGGNIMGIIVILIAQHGIGLGAKGNTKQQNQAASFYTLIMIAAILTSGMILYLFFNSELKRTNLEKERKVKQSNQETLIEPENM